MSFRSSARLISTDKFAEMDSKKSVDRNVAKGLQEIIVEEVREKKEIICVQLVLLLFLWMIEDPGIF